MTLQETDQRGRSRDIRVGTPGRRRGDQTKGGSNGVRRRLVGSGLPATVSSQSLPTGKEDHWTRRDRDREVIGKVWKDQGGLGPEIGEVGVSYWNIR